MELDKDEPLVLFETLTLATQPELASEPVAEIHEIAMDDSHTIALESAEIAAKSSALNAPHNPASSASLPPIAQPSVAPHPTPQPPTAQPSRLVLHKLIQTNFKSYAGRVEIGPFHQSFTSVVGPNGSGFRVF